MFIKPFKVKRNNLLKSSDKKLVKQKIAVKYPKITDQQFEEIFPNKKNLYYIKLISFHDVPVTVYSSEKRPMFFELNDNEIYPTVYTLWLVPDLLPVFTTQASVLPVLGKGADLMSPGVVRKGEGLKSWGRYNKGDIVSINVITNKSCCAVGSLARSSEDLYMAGGQGVCVHVKHVFGDKLWGIEPSACLQIPIKEAAIPVPKSVDFPALGQEKAKEAPKPESLQGVEVLDSVEGITGDVEQLELTDDASEIVEDIDENTPDRILKRGFLTALKLNGKSLKLPLLVSTFYAANVQPACDPKVDIKHTSYKKLSKFLAEMAEEGFLGLKQEIKGVEQIVSVNLDHPEIMNFVPCSSSNQSDAQNDSQTTPMVTHVLNSMTKLFVITEETYPFFSYFGMTKDKCLEEAEVLKCFKDYVMKNRLQDPANRSNILPDKALELVIGKPDSIEFKLALQFLYFKMPSKYEMRSTVASKTGKAPVIQITTKNCKGNKKVTLVNNLEQYGILINEFAKQCKLGVQASTTIVQSEHVKGNQLLVQGNQVRFVYNLLTGTYKVPPRNITGLEFAKKEPKAKK